MTAAAARLAPSAAPGSRESALTLLDGMEKVLNAESDAAPTASPHHLALVYLLVDVLDARDSITGR